MTLPISSVVDVVISVAPTAVPAPGFGLAGIVSDDLDMVSGVVPALRVSKFNSITEIAAVYDVLTSTYVQANSYFSQRPRPDELAVISQYINNTPGVLTGLVGTAVDVTPWNAISLGEFNVTLGGFSADVTGLDFSTAIDIDAVAAIIQTGLQAIAQGAFTLATCVYSLTSNSFVITTGTDGATITATAPAINPISLIDISDLMRTTNIWLSSLVQGTVIETPIDALNAAEVFDNSFYGVLVLAKHRDTQVSDDVASWVQARIKVYSMTTNNPNTLIPGDQTHAAWRMFNLSYDRTIVSFSSTATEYPDAALLGEAFTTDFNVPNSVKTLKFKIFEGIGPENITSLQKGALDDVRANASVRIGASSMFAESFMSGQLFFDERHTIDWLTGQLETNLFNYLSSRPTRVALTDVGSSSLEQQVIRGLDQGVANGMLAPGTTSEGDFLGRGYTTSVLPVAQQDPAKKASRESPPISFIALFASASHFVEVRGVVER